MRSFRRRACHHRSSMASGFDANKFNREMRAAQRKAEAAWKREVGRVNRENQRAVDKYNREVERHNKRVIADHNRQIAKHNREADAHNRRVIADINRRLRLASSSGPTYTDQELELADRIRRTIPRDDREWDTFVSYARIDGADVAGSLRTHLSELGVSVWFDELTIEPGKSQARQMDKGLQNARAGIVVLTPAYIAGRFWTERELGVLLGKETLIPVLHNVSFDDVRQYSGILPDLAGFETARDSLAVIAEKIAAAVVVSFEEGDAEAA